MKILHYIATYAPAWKFGGALSAVSQLAEELVNLNHQVEVFTSNAGLENQSGLTLNKQIIRNGVKVTYFEKKPGMGIYCPGMEQAIKDRAREFDIIHITGVWQRTTPSACNSAIKQGVPYVISTQGALGTYSWRQKTGKKLLYYFLREKYNCINADLIHYTTQQELEECRWLQLPSQVFIVPNGLDTKLWQPGKDKAKAWRKLQNISENDFVILNVGRLHHKKGLDLLPKVLSSLKELKWQIIFVGNDDDGTKTELQKEFQSENLLERVHFFTSCEPQELPAIYSAANLFVLPSRHESFGNVVIEALACQCPVLISDKVGLHNEVNQAGMGWVRPRIAEEWTNLIQELIQSPSKLEKITSTSREWTKSIFSIEKTAQDMANNYIKLIDKQVHK